MVRHGGGRRNAADRYHSDDTYFGRPNHRLEKRGHISDLNERMGIGAGGVQYCCKSVCEYRRETRELKVAVPHDDLLIKHCDRTEMDVWCADTKLWSTLPTFMFWCGYTGDTQVISHEQYARIPPHFPY